MEEDVRTNPETCEHNVIGQKPEGDGWVPYCVSCETTFEPRWMLDKVWDFDIDTNWWVRNRRMERTQAPTDPDE